MTDGVLTTFEIKPGFQKNNTPFASQAEWVDGDKVRFKYGYPEKMGGWNQRAVTSAQTGIPRAIHTWSDLQGDKLLAIGTNRQLAIYFTGNDFLDVTPVGFKAGLASNLVAFGYGSGPYSGDYQPFAQISAGTDVTSLVSLGVSISGVTSADLGYSFSPTSISAGAGFSGVQLTQWTLDNFGEDLIANERGRSIYRWDRSSVQTTLISGASVTIGINPIAVSIQNAPKANTIAISEPSPYLIAFGTCAQGGAFDPLLIRWADQQNFTDWGASANNTAGDFRVQGGSEIIGVQKTKRETLVFTDDVVYSMRFTGGTAIFAFERLAANSGMISQHAAIDVNAVVYWMGPSSFFKYDGRVQPLLTPMDETVFDRNRLTSLNDGQREKVYAGINSEFSEIWWLYPSRDSIENNRYIIYNYLEDLWYDGTIDRTCWTDGDVFELPIAAYGVSANPPRVESSVIASVTVNVTIPTVQIYDHELTRNDNGTPMRSWIKSGVFDIDSGDKLMFIDKIVPDFTQLVGTVDLRVVGKKYPQATSIVKGPYSISKNSRKTNVRLRARQLQFTVSSCVLDGNWELGDLRGNIRPDGER